MDWLQFIDGMAGHILSLPVVFLTLIFLLRKHIGPLIERLLEISIGKLFKMTFSDKLALGKAIIDHEPPLPEMADDTDIEIELEQDQTTAPDNETVVERGRHKTHDSKWIQPNLQGKALWNTTAAGQIISGFEAVDEVVREIGKTMGFEPSNGVDELMIMGALAAKKAISGQIFELYKTLGDGRNLIANARAFPHESETLEFVRQAAYLLATLTNLKHKIDRGQIKL